MKKRELFLHALSLSFFLITTVLFIVSNRASYLHLFVFPEILPWQQEAFHSLHWVTFFMGILHALLGISVFTLAAFLWGAGFFRWTTLSLPIMLSALVLGEILLSIVFLSLLTLTGLQPEITAILLAFGTLPGALRLSQSIRQNFATWHKKAPNRPIQSTIDWLLLFIFIAALGLSAARLSYDATAYYFTQSRLMAITGQPRFTYAGDAFVVSSFHPGILFTVVIQLFGDQTARLLSWVNGGVILLMGLSLAEKVGISLNARRFFAVLLLTSTAFVDLLGDGKVELISTAPIIVALWWMVDSLKKPSYQRFIFIGTLLGFAIIARPYNIFLIPVFTILFYLFQLFPILRKEGIRATWRYIYPTLWMLIPILLMGVFHLWQNDLWLGSPFAPLTYASHLNATDWQWQFDPIYIRTIRLLYPLAITFLNNPQSLGTISPLFIGILPFLSLQSIRSRLHIPALLSTLLIPAVITLTLWITLFFTIVEIRYVFFLWVLIFLFGAQVLESIFANNQNAFRVIVRLTIILLQLIIFARIMLISLAAYSPIASNRQTHCYDTPFCTFLEPLNRIAPSGARVFALNAYRYYLRPDLFACASQAQEYHPLQTLAKERPSDFWSELYRQGFQYVTYEKNFAEFHSHFGTIPSPENAPDWLKIVPISKVANEIVYSLQAIHSPVPIEKICQQDEKGRWQVVYSQP